MVFSKKHKTFLNLKLLTFLGSQVQTSYIQHSSSDYHNSFSNQKKYGSLNRVNNTSHSFVQNNEVYNRDEKYDARFSSLKRNGSLSARQNNQYSLHSTPENNYEIEGHSGNVCLHLIIGCM